MKKTSILLQLLILTFSAHSQTFNEARLDSLFSRIDKNQMGMGSISIFKNGNEVYRNSIGYLDVENSVHASAKTKYRIGSVSKSFTAAIIMQLIEENKLNFDTRLAGFFPEIPNAEEITIEQLLRHQSGLYNFTNSADYPSWMEKTLSEPELIKIFVRNGTVFNPGEKTEYSNTNYVLLSFVAEKIENKDFADILKKRIVQPLKLKYTYYGSKINPKRNEALSYTKLSSWEVAPETNMSIPAGAGGIVATPTELNIFYDNLFSGKLVSKNSFYEMVKTVENFGIGLLKMPFYQKTAFGHNGRIDGFYSIAAYFPEDSVAVTYLSNGVLMPVNDILIGALSIFFGIDYALPDFKPSLDIKSEDLDKYLGVYSSPDFPLKISIYKQGNILIGQASGQSSFILDAYEIHKFKYDQAMLKIEFLPEENKLIFKQGETEFVFTKED